MTKSIQLLKESRRFFQKYSNVQSVSVVADQSNQEVLDDINTVLPYSKVPGPKPLPLLGNTWRFLPYIGDFEIEHIDKVSKRLYDKYGPIVKIEGLLGRPDMLFLFDPDEIERVFRQEDNMPLRPSMPSLNYYKHVYQKEFFGDVGGVIAVHGQNWQWFRSKVNQIMMQPRVAKMYIGPIEATAKEFVERIKRLKNAEDEMPDDFLNEIHKWSLESIAKVALDVRLGCLADDAAQESQELIDAVNTFFINVPILELKAPVWRIFPTKTFKDYIHSLETIRQICMKHINKSLNMKKHRTNIHEMSVLERVIAMDNDAKIASILALDLFLVGIDTTSNAVGSILYQLATHPEVQEMARDEILRVAPNYDDCLDSKQLEDMVYTKACIREVLRMYPVVIGNGRCTTIDSVIGGYMIPKGVQVIFQHYVISNLDKYFENSGKFMPERWMKGKHSHTKEHHPFASLPFGFGKRMCLGKRFADLEIQMAIVKILQQYKLEYHHEKLDYHIHPMYTPNGPLRIKFSNISK